MNVLERDWITFNNCEILLLLIKKLINNWLRLIFFELKLTDAYVAKLRNHSTFPLVIVYVNKNFLFIIFLELLRFHDLKDGIWKTLFEYVYKSFSNTSSKLKITTICMSGIISLTSQTFENRFKKEFIILYWNKIIYFKHTNIKLSTP